VYVNFSLKSIKQLPSHQIMALPELNEDLASGCGG